MKENKERDLTYNMDKLWLVEYKGGQKVYVVCPTFDVAIGAAGKTMTEDFNITDYKFSGAKLIATSKSDPNIGNFKVVVVEDNEFVLL